MNESETSSRSDTDAAPPVQNDIAAGGGWVEVTQRYRPKTNLFCMLAVLWCFPTAGALVIVFMNAFRWFEAGSLLEAFRAIGFDQWIALGLIVAHSAIGWLAWKFRRDEPFRERVLRIPNPDCDPGKLY